MENKLIEPFIEVPEELWSIDYDLVVKEGVEHPEHKFSRVCGNPLLVYNDLIYVVNNEKKTAILTYRIVDYCDVHGWHSYAQRGF